MIVFNSALAIFLDPGGDLAGGIMIGALVGQTVLLAVWASLGPATVLERMSAGVALLGSCLISIMAWGRRTGHPRDEVVILTLVLLSTWILLQIPLWSIRYSHGWRLGFGDTTTEIQSDNEMQYGIRQLIAWMALVGVITAVLRLVAASYLTDLNPDSWSSRVLPIVFTVTLFGTLAAFPVVWAAFVKRRFLAWILAAAVCCALITVAEGFAFVWVVGGKGDPEVAIPINIVQFVSVLLALCSLRFAGLRLFRDRRWTEEPVAVTSH
jgi:hypothetical protein